MLSRLYLFLHTVFLFGLIGLCLLSPLIKAAYPAEFRQYFLWIIVGMGLLLKIAWEVFGGCPLTVWENNARRREGRRTYKESCTNHYTEKWFGWRPPEWFSSALPFTALAIPLITGFFF